MSYKRIKGNFVRFALLGDFDVVFNPCNCSKEPEITISEEIVKQFRTDKFPLEVSSQQDKLGCIDVQPIPIELGDDQVKILYIVNAYIRGHYYNPIDSEALKECLDQIVDNFPNKTIGIPEFETSLAGELLMEAIKHSSMCNIIVVSWYV